MIQAKARVLRHVSVLALCGALLGGGIVLALDTPETPGAPTAELPTTQSTAPSAPASEQSVSTPAEEMPQATVDTERPAPNSPAPSSATTPPTQPTPTTASPAPVAQAPTYRTANLSINGQQKGSVTVETGANHCDVLNKALQTGLIGSLDMRYYAQFQSYGVYVIDGIGNSDTIWWTYKVNGQSLPYGCSRATVADGDNVDWKYLK